MYISTSARSQEEKNLLVPFFWSGIFGGKDFHVFLELAVNLLSR